MENQELEQKNQELFSELAKYPAGSKEYRDVASKIVKNNEGLVRFVAKKYFFLSRECPTINDDDLIAEGYFGMLKAIQTFDPAKGTFATCARQWIQSYLSRYLKRELRQQKHIASSLQDNLAQESGDEQKLEDVVASPVNVEADFVAKIAEDEAQQQIALLKERVERLTKKQRDVLTAKYFSGKGQLTDVALAEQFECTFQNISQLEKAGIANLQKMYGVELNMLQGANMTEAEKIKTKAVLKDLILAKLSPSQKKTMLCKFYSSSTPKTNAQVAQEFDSTESNVQSTVNQSCRKLCTLCDSVRNTKHLRSILEFSPKEIGKEY